MASVTFDHISKSFDEFDAVKDLDLAVQDGELLVLVGPSGCGKSTALRMVAGLETPTGGEIYIGEKCVTDVTPRERDVAMVFQNYALYPHMTVERNLGFGLKLKKANKKVIAERVAQAATMLELNEHLEKRPGQLSGGQRQRVAMGRAIVREPQVFLMDEPLSNLDAKLRVTMRAEIVALQRQLQSTMIYVTHDQVEALTMGHRVAVMCRGVLQQVAPPDELFDAPANAFVAGFIGTPSMNLYSATISSTDDGGRRLDIGASHHTYSAIEVAGTSLEAVDDGRTIVGIRPHQVQIVEQSNATAVTRLVESLGTEVLIHAAFDAPVFKPADGTTFTDDGEEVSTTLDSQLVIRIDPTASRPNLGENIAVHFPAKSIHLFDVNSEERITSSEPAMV